MTEEEIKQKLLAQLKNIAPDTEPEKLQPNDNIRQTLGIDSFDYLQFITALDEQMSIQTPEEDYGKIETLETLLAYIGEREKQLKK